MKLKSVQLINFQCFRDSGSIPIHNLTVFIGENDSGKTAVLRALDYFFNDKILPEIMFHEVNGNRQKSCEITLTFSINGEYEGISNLMKLDGEFVIKKTFTIENDGISTKTLINKLIFEDIRLNDVYRLSAKQIKIIFEEIGLEYTTVDESKARLHEHLEINYKEFPTSKGWQEIKWSTVSKLMPIYEYYDGASYGNPQALINNTLKGVYRSFFYDVEQGEESLKESLIEKKSEIMEALDRKINEELYDKLQNVIDSVVDIRGDYSIDFASGFNLSSIILDFGTGFRNVNNIGEGSKKRLFLAITEWDKEIRIEDEYRNVIRGYDEPDSSLHYSAQKKMYYLLSNIANEQDSQVQGIICTHSLSMIDRAPAGTINYFKNNEGVSQIIYLLGYDDAEIRSFLFEISEISGISNSQIFFEKCLLLIEGDSEENALPVLYKKYTGRSMIEDGVVLINLYSNSAWKPFLKLIKINKSQATLMSLDSDTQEAKSTRLTVRSLTEIGFNQEFLDRNVFFMGAQEFEDMFSTGLICKCLNKHWPKNGEDEWIEHEIEPLRNQEKKVSSELARLVELYMLQNAVDYERFRKPTFGTNIAELLTIDELQNIPQIVNLFDRVEEIIT